METSMRFAGWCRQRLGNMPTGQLSGSVRVRVVRVRQALSARSSLRSRNLLRQLAKSLAQVHAIAKHVCCTLGMTEEEGEDGLVRLGCIAALTGEHEVVAPIVRTLPTPGGDVVEGYGGLIVPEAAVGADRTVGGDEPLAGLEVGAPVGRERGEL